MNSTLRRTFVLGAGFTKAFLPDAPLLTDYFYHPLLQKQFAEFQHASRILLQEVNRNLPGQINIERLMTRLDAGMPYDSEGGAEPELALLLKELKRNFIRRLDDAKMGKLSKAEMGLFAKYCVDNQINCITFNYDDVFDEALWGVTKAVFGASQPYWHPDGGYGFFCKPAAFCVREVQCFMDATPMLLLKLHGSINWRIKRGASRPYSIDAVVHHEPWLPLPLPVLGGTEEKDMAHNIELHLEPEPFIVPPVLVKSVLVAQPILRLVWSLAYRELERSDEVTFVGYSFPRTDIAASFLFSEALGSLPVSRIRVINLPSAREATLDAYRDVFPGIADDQFIFKDALGWAVELIDKE